jgi:hypothetical protein
MSAENVVVPFARHAEKNESAGADAAGAPHTDSAPRTGVQSAVDRNLTPEQLEGRELARRLYKSAIQEASSEEAFARRIGKKRSWVSKRNTGEHDWVAGDFLRGATVEVLRYHRAQIDGLIAEREGRHGAATPPNPIRALRLASVNAKALHTLHEMVMDGKVERDEARDGLPALRDLVREGESLLRDLERIASES